MKFSGIKLIFLLTGLMLEGCSGIPVITDDGTVHHLIIGVGIVSVPRSVQVRSTTVIKSQSLGLSFSDQPGIKLSMGYATDSTILVPDGTHDFCAEISQWPLGALKMESCLSQPGSNENIYNKGGNE